MTLTLKIENLKCLGATSNEVEIIAQPGQDKARYFTPISEGENVSIFFDFSYCQEDPSGVWESNIDPAIADKIEAFWPNYDLDKSGCLNKIDAFRFAKDVLQLNNDEFSEIWSRLDRKN